MDQQLQDRWTEVQFLTICKDVIKINGDTMDLMDLIDAVATLGKFSAEPVKQLAQELLTTFYIQPTQEETSLLCKKFDIPIYEIKRVTNFCNKTLYKRFQADEEDPRPFYPRLPKHKIQYLRPFVETFIKLRKVGIQYGPLK